MLRLKDENELSSLGLKIHPSDPTQAVPLNQPTDSLPDKSWTLERLGQFAAASVAESKRLQREVACLARKSTVQVFLAGCALTFAKNKVKGEDKKWGSWLKERKIPRTNAWEAMELSRLAERVEAVADLTLTQAKQKLGVTKPPKRQGCADSGKAGLPPPKAPAKKGSAKKFVAVKEPRNPRWPVISDNKPNPNTPPPPAKENPNSPLAVLVKVRGRLEYLRSDLANIDWKVESSEDYRCQLREITSLIERIAKEVPNG